MFIPVIIPVATAVSSTLTSPTSPITLVNAQTATTDAAPGFVTPFVDTLPIHVSKHVEPAETADAVSSKVRIGNVHCTRDGGHFNPNGLVSELVFARADSDSEVKEGEDQVDQAIPPKVTFIRAVDASEHAAGATPLAVNPVEPEEAEPEHGVVQPPSGNLKMPGILRSPWGKTLTPDVIKSPSEKRPVYEVIESPSEKVKEPQVLQSPWDKLLVPVSSESPVDDKPIPEVIDSPSDKKPAHEVVKVPSDKDKSPDVVSTDTPGPGFTKRRSDKDPPAEGVIQETQEILLQLSKWVSLIDVKVSRTRVALDGNPSAKCGPLLKDIEVDLSNLLAWTYRILPDLLCHITGSEGKKGFLDNLITPRADEPLKLRKDHEIDDKECKEVLSDLQQTLKFIIVSLETTLHQDLPKAQDESRFKAILQRVVGVVKDTQNNLEDFVRDIVDVIGEPGTLLTLSDILTEAEHAVFDKLAATVPGLLDVDGLRSSCEELLPGQSLADILDTRGSVLRMVLTQPAIDLLVVLEQEAPQMINYDLLLKLATKPKDVLKPVKDVNKAIPLKRDDTSEVSNSAIAALDAYLEFVPTYVYPGKPADAPVVAVVADVPDDNKLVTRAGDHAAAGPTKSLAMGYNSMRTRTILNDFEGATPFHDKMWN